VYIVWGEVLDSLGSCRRLWAGFGDGKKVRIGPHVTPQTHPPHVVFGLLTVEIRGERSAGAW